MSKFSALFAIFCGVFLLSLFMLSCDPPHFIWPDKSIKLNKVTLDGPTEYDNWKKIRRLGKNPGLIVGAAKVDLTPKRSKGQYIAGYMPNKRSNGLGGPITGRVLFIDDGKTSLALVSVDFIGLMNDRVWDIRHKLSRQGNQLDLLVASTHNHEGPDTMGLWGPAMLYMIPTGSGVDEGYMNRVENDLARAVTQAAINAKPARLYASSVQVPDGINENLHKPGYKDNEMTVLQARGLDGSTIGTLVNYACHAEFLGQNNAMMHHDFPGYIYPKLEANEGGVAVFMNGALGGMIAPAMPHWTENYVSIRRRRAEKAGLILADTASQSLKIAVEIKPEEISIKRRLIKFPLENDGFQYLAKMGIMNRINRNNTLYSETWRIDIGQLTMVSVPGEILPALGFDIKEMMPAKYKMIFGLANDEIGYIMDSDNWQESLYSYERTVSLGSKTGTILMEHIHKMFPEAKLEGSASGVK